ncbi:MAG: hypothetical protein WCS36_02155 [Candidatus Neomarinimicrobiota bacterium]
MRTIIHLLIIGTVCLTVSLAQTNEQDREMRRGFVDQNQDGINDWFQDANGDGINDIDQKRYRHNFRFQDRDQDGINDLYRDADGDGVNDLDSKFTDADGDGRSENIIDADKDWINDITGEIYTRRDLGGYRYGFILEEYHEQLKDFTDRDGDGQDDRVQKREGMQEQRRMDRFIDTDGDGVCDQRGFSRHRQSGRRPGRGK